MLLSGARGSAGVTPGVISYTVAPEDALGVAEPAGGALSFGTSAVDAAAGALSMELPKPRGVTTLATLRCAEPTRRVLLRFRTIEGHSGEAAVTLVVSRTPPTSAAIVRVPLRPLSHHYRLLEPLPAVESALASAWANHCAHHEKRAAEASALLTALQPRLAAAAGGEFASGSGAGASGAGGSGSGAAGSRFALPPSPPPGYPLGVLTCTGSFSLPQMHEWVATCLPDVPSRIVAEDGREEVTLAFRNGFVGTLLLVSYKRGSAVFRSDSPSALAILRDAIISAATAAKVRLSLTADVPPYGLRHIMALLHCKLVYLLTLQAKAEVLEAVREMVTTETAAAAAAGLPSPDLSFLHPAFADILANGDLYARHMRARKRMLSYVAGVAGDAWVDFHKFRGRDVAARLPEVLARLTGGAIGGAAAAATASIGPSDAYHVRPLETIAWMEQAY